MFEAIQSVANRLVESSVSLSRNTWPTNKVLGIDSKQDCVNLNVNRGK